MEAKVLFQTLIPLSSRARARRRRMHKPETLPFVHAVLTKPAEDVARVSVSDTTSVYNDNWFDRLAINHLSQSVQATSGLRNSKSGYESLLEAARVASKNFNPIQQREIVVQALERAFPRPILSLIKTILPDSKLAREYFAVFTTVFFAWLVGPCEVRESELNGRKEKNVVHIKKCRFLEESNCVGLCINMCKIPSQTFIKDSLGMPVNMVPNFDDMSCEMVFGQEPPAATHDPALKQPCYKLCNHFSYTFTCIFMFPFIYHKNFIAWHSMKINTRLPSCLDDRHMWGQMSFHIL